MAAKLSSWERAQRQQERENDRRRAADHRATERARARGEREAEKASARRAQERDRSRRRRERERERESAEAAKQAQIDEWREEVEQFDGYLEAVTGFHRYEVDLEGWRAEYAERAKPKNAHHQAFSPAIFPETFETRHFEERVFEPVAYGVSRERSQESNGAWALFALAVASVGAHFYPGVDLPQPLLALALVVLLAIYVVYRALLRARFKTAEQERAARHEEAEQARRAAFDLSQVQRRAEFDARKAAFEASETERAEQFERQAVLLEDEFDRTEEERIGVLEDAQSGAVGAVELLCEALLPLADLPEAPEDEVGALVSDHEIGYRVHDGSKIQMLIRLPSLAMVPDRIIEMTPAGTKQRAKAMPDKRRREIYDQFVASFSIGHACRLLKVYPFVRKIEIDATVYEPDPKSGELRDVVVLTAAFEAEKLARLTLARTDPVGALGNFDHAFNALAKAAAAQTPGRVDPDAVTWATPDNRGVDVPDGVLPGWVPPMLRNEFASRPTAMG